MAKFKYRMQNILNVKLQLETQAKMELGRQQALLREEQDRLKSLEDRKEDYLEEGRRIRGDVLNAGQLRDNANAISAMDDLILAQEDRVDEALLRVEQARMKLQEVMQDRKMHEKLKEKAFEQFMGEEKAAEGKAVDELTSYTYGQRRQG
jgi:flagellar protein FliJ